MAYLFDTDAISEVLRKRPLAEYLEWLGTVPREDQHTSAICIGCGSARTTMSGQSLDPPEMATTCGEPDVGRASVSVAA